MAQKTLIIGLGSTGLKIAHDVLAKIADEFGSLDRVPWVEVACFETARVEDDDLLRGRQGDLGISGTQYETLVGNLSQYDDMDALAWTDQKALKAKDLAQGTTDGAGNVRMIGRLCWVFSKNLSNFQTLVLDKVNRLGSITENQAGKALGTWPYKDGPAEVRFTREPDSEQDRITIYVCGTLTGGTCSGSFIDVGYFLSKLAATRSFPRIGLFTIPNSGHPNLVRLANAYAALRELNHYHSSGSVFKAKYPGMGSVEVLTATPYKSVFLGQPSGGGDGAVGDVIRSFSQYIYLQAITPVGDALQAELVNPNAARSGASDTYGNPMNFNSLGVSVIEFPAEHVVKGCTAFLMSRAVDEWNGQIELDGGTARQLILGTLRLETSALSNDILRSATGTAPFRDSIAGEVDRAVRAARDGAMEVMSEVQASLDGAFDPKSAATGQGLGRGSLEIQIRENGDQLIKTRVKEISDYLHSSMKDGGRGPNYCIGLVKSLKSYSAEQRSALNQELENIQQRLISAGASLTDARERIEDCHSAGIMKMPGYKQTALNICCREYEDALQSLYFTKLDSMTIESRYHIYDALYKMAERYEARLSNGMYGIIGWAGRLKDKLTSSYDTLVDTPPQVNGRLIYDPSTIPHYYADTIKDAKPGADSPFGAVGVGEAYAKFEIISEWEWIANQFTTTETSYFDTPRFDADKDLERAVIPSQYEELSRAARGYFLTILRTNVCDMLVQGTDYTTEVLSAFRKSNELISIEDNPRNKVVSGDGPSALHKPRLAFFTNAPNASDESAAGRVRAVLDGIVPRNNFGTLLAPYRIVFVTARATFSISTIDGLRPEAGSDGDTMRRAYLMLQAQDGRSYQTRKDVRWKSLETAVAFDGFPKLKARLLGALATKQMEYSAGSGLTLKYDVHDLGDRVGRLPLGRDLDEAAYSVHDDQRVDGALMKSMEIEEGKPFQYGPSLRDLTNQISTFGLTDKGDPLDGPAAKRILRGYVLTIPGLKDNYDVQLVAPTKEDYFRPAERDKPEGYYCPSCNAFLMDRASTQEFPDSCKCGNRLRFDR